MSFTITGPKTTGSNPPQMSSTTQGYVDWLTNLGIPEDNILWNVVGEESGYSLSVNGIYSTPSIDNVVLSLAGGTLQIQDLASTPTIGNVQITLEGAGGGDLIIDSMFSTAAIGNVTLSQQGGTLYISDITSTPSIGNVEITEAGGTLSGFTDNFTGSNGDPWNSSYWETNANCTIQGNKGRISNTTAVS
jgi:hypothetical protein